MKKRALVLLLTAVLTLSLVPAAAAAGGVAYARTQKVELNGGQTTFQAYALKDPRTGYETNYVKLRDLALALRGTSARFEVGWSGAVDLTLGEVYTPNGTEDQTPWTGDRAYTPYTGKTKVNGVEVKLDAIILRDDQGGGYTYYKLRDLGAALGFGVDWDPKRGVILDTAQAATRLAVPDPLAYFGQDARYTAGSGGSLTASAKVDLTGATHYGKLFDGYFDLLEEKGYALKQVDKIEHPGNDIFWETYFFQYTGAGSEGLKGLRTVDGQRYDLQIGYTTLVNYEGSKSYTELECQVGPGLTVQDPGERDGRWNVKAYRAPAVTPDPTPTPTPTPEPEPDPVVVPVQPVRCGYCGGKGEVKCPVCRGSGGVERWDPVGKEMTVQMCPTCYWAGTLPCPACGGDGWLDGDEG